jgi:putative Holliday junction resolvase
VRRSREEDFAAIEGLVAEHGVGLVVVGQPLTLDGTEGPQARRFSRYAEALAGHLHVPVTSWDERYSTVTADEILRKNRRKRRPRTRANGEIDAVAAAVILQSYLDSQSDEPS